MSRARLAMPRRRRLGLLTAVLALLGAAALLPSLEAHAAGNAAAATGISCTTDGTTTCTQTDPTHFAYIPAVKKSKTNPGNPGGTATVPPSVTITQTSDLVYQTVSVSWRNFTPSFNQDGGVGADTTTVYGVMVYECHGTDPQVPPAPKNDGQPEDCYSGLASQPLLGTHGLGNAVEGFTSPDGTGSVNIAVETNAENDLVGCTSASPCSLVVVPNWGGEQGTAASVNCSNHRDDTKSQSGEALIALDGAPCSWGDRITVPLTFTPAPSACSGSAAFASEGSPMLQQAMLRWRPGWCTDTDPLTLNYDSGTTESQARQDFTEPSGPFSDSTDVGFTSLPATAEQSSQRAFTYAPVANTGIVIAFVIDDPTTGQQLTHLTLDARIVAKLLTQSYSLGYSQPVCVTGAPTGTQRGCDYSNMTQSYGGHLVPCSASMPQSGTCDPAVAGNPSSIVSDPEFRALNPSLFPAGQPAKISTAQVSLGQFLPILAGGNTDLTYALTDWIASDPDASSFLAGAQDGYGMHLNTYYKGNVYWPTGQLEQLDPGYSTNAQYPGYGTMQASLNPVQSLSNVVQSLLSNQPTDIDTLNFGPPTCNIGRDPTDTTDPPCSYSRQASENEGTRVLFAVMDAADAGNFGFPTATLVNSAGVGVDANAASISAAVHDVKADPDGITTTPDYTQQIQDPAAYPVAITDYAMVPTCSTASSTTSSIVRFLGLVASKSSQTNGLGVGQLTPGYAPLSSTQVMQLSEASSEVAGQKTCLPGTSNTPVPSNPPGTSGPTSSSGSSDTGAISPQGDDGSADTGNGGDSRNFSTSPAGAENHTLAPNNKTVADSRPGVKGGIGAGPLVLILVLSTVGGLGLLAAGPGTWWVATTASGTAFRQRARRAVRR